MEIISYILLVVNLLSGGGTLLKYISSGAAMIPCTFVALLSNIGPVVMADYLTFFSCQSIIHTEIPYVNQFGNVVENRVSIGSHIRFSPGKIFSVSYL